MAQVLIIDDDVQLCKALGMVIASMGHRVDSANYLVQGLEMARQGRYDLVILDIGLPDGSGLDALPEIHDCRSRPEVIILSASGDPDGAELAIRSGAWSYIPKPPTMSAIKLPVSRAIEYRRQKLSRSASHELRRDAVIGASDALAACLELAAQAAETDANVLITGETGTGKELLARVIHENSRRAGGPFVIVDCAALPENLVESVLFGHERGAFTGADKRSGGLVRQAHQGTLFLDEIGELPLSVQKSFLRVIQEHRFRPVGGEEEVQSDFRLIAATNRDLDALVTGWDFRQDLLFRIRTIAIEAPPLRARRGDVARLTAHFLRACASRDHAPPKQCSPDFLDALEAYPWPGNVRELSNALESALAQAGPESILLPRHLPVDIRVTCTRQALAGRDRDRPGDAATGPGDGAPGPEGFPNLKEYREQVLARAERRYLRDLFTAAEGEVRAACGLSGLSRARLYALLKKHGLSRRELSGPAERR
ncbi:MAG: sigma-54-dependent transcriptional regulator [Desulfovibrionaceae bacterium]